MAKVKNLKIQFQTGSSGTLFATWAFDGTKASSGSSSSSSSSIKVGDYVKIKSGSKWYNGVAIDSWVFGYEWKVYELIGKRAVLSTNKGGSNNIMSPINVNNLTKASSKAAVAPRASESVSYLDYYQVKWYYDTGNSVWFEGSEEQAKSAQSTYSPPENSTRVKITVKPVAKKHKVNKKEVAYWSGTSVSVTYSISSNPPEVPSTPTVEIEDYALTATIDNVSDPRSDKIQFQVYDMTTLFDSGTVDVSAAMAAYKCNVNAGGSYRVRARAINLVSNKNVYSDWSDFANAVDTIPAPPTEITVIRATSSTSVYLEWPVVNSAETYEIEYTTKLEYFDNSSETTSVTGIEYNHYTVTGLETGDEYFFRVRAVNAQGESAYTEPVSATLGKAPSAPTTWASSTTVIVGEILNLYWVHNAKDGSTEQYAEVEIRINDGEPQVHTVKNDLADDDENEDKDKTKHYEIDTSDYEDGAQIKWRVRTAGVTLQYGDWSVQRVVDIYAPPTLSLTVTNQNGDLIQTLSSFPFYVKGVAGPKTQAPIGYHLTIVADEGYQTVDNVGRNKIVSAGDEVYSEFFDTSEVLLVEFTPGNIDLENNIPYSVVCIATMDSGLNATASESFNVSWEDDTFNLDAEIGFDPDTFVAYITPYCYQIEDETEVVDPEAPEPDPIPVEGVTMSVYRREYDGTYVEIATGLPSNKNTVVTDPHPALDYARYRIVAITDDTGAVTYYDPPGYPVDCGSIIIQWDEEWSWFDPGEYGDELEHPPWRGSLIELKYNIDVSDNNTPDVALVNYVGRTYPVSYYGSSISSTSSWNTAIPKDDIDTIYALRRLAIWKGDCYVREPSGSGYWANVAVSFSQSHDDLTIPITFDITRVEGGL